jgi:hypothetical protein
MDQVINTIINKQTIWVVSTISETKSELYGIPGKQKNHVYGIFNDFDSLLNGMKKIIIHLYQQLTDENITGITSKLIQKTQIRILKNLQKLTPNDNISELALDSFIFDIQNSEKIWRGFIRKESIYITKFDTPNQITYKLDSSNNTVSDTVSDTDSDSDSNSDTESDTN